MQVVAPDDYLSMSMSCFVVSSKKEAQAVCDYLMSDEQIAEHLEINEYEFTEEGKRL